MPTKAAPTKVTEAKTKIDAGAKKTDSKPTVTSSAHPKYDVMIKSAISELSEKGGSSRQAILKLITNKYTLGARANVNLNSTLKKLLESNEIIRAKSSATGANGSFKLPKNVKKDTSSEKSSKPADDKEPQPKKVKTSKIAAKPTALLSASSASSADESGSGAPVVKKPVKAPAPTKTTEGDAKKKIKKPRVTMTPATKRFNGGATRSKKSKSPQKPKAKRAGKAVL
ncbi:histone H1-delta-like [Symsagittifera roscoffensis]|uniref:histone H1-delta-like n=1 Tax=Symsagittifera roscoffensis TaxID=84072 RepID=UPI00307B1B20